MVYGLSGSYSRTLCYAMLCDYMQPWKCKEKSAGDYEMYEEGKERALKQISSF